MDHYGQARPSHRRPWTEDEDRVLAEMVGQDELISVLANVLGRTREAVRNRANLLGLSVRSSEGRGRRRMTVDTVVPGPMVQG